MTLNPSATQPGSPPGPDHRRLHVTIRGRVQGVSFRYATRDRALELGLGGWVCNLADGRVEAVFEGTEANLKKMAAWCHRGPSAASVEDVAERWEDAQGVFSGFAVRG